MRKSALFVVIVIASLLGGVIGWGAKSLDGVGWNYVEETLRNQSKNIEDLEEYIKNRRVYETDLIAFKQLYMVLEDQKDGKYSPWLITKLGLVKFDENGFVEKICFLPTELNNPDCPPSL